MGIGTVPGLPGDAHIHVVPVQRSAGMVESFKEGIVGRMDGHDGRFTRPVER